MEHRTHTPVQVVLKLAVNFPKPSGTLVECVLGHLPALQLEHLKQGRVAVKIADGLQLRVRVDATGDNLHQSQVNLLTAPALRVQELPYLQPRDSGETYGLRADGARLLLDKARQTDGQHLAAALTLLALRLGTKHGVVLPGIFRLTVLHV